MNYKGFTTLSIVFANIYILMFLPDNELFEFSKWAKDVYQQSDSVCQEEIAHRHKYFDCVGT